MGARTAEHTLRSAGELGIAGDGSLGWGRFARLGTAGVWGRLAGDGWGRLGMAGDGWGRLGTLGTAGDRWGPLGTAA